VVDEVKMRRGHWLGLILCVFFSTLTLIVGDRQDIWPVKKP